MNKNLEKLRQATENMSYTNMVAFRYVLMNRLSQEVPMSMWDMLIEEVKEVFKKEAECRATRTKEKNYLVLPLS